jgi:hypothetical protein
MDYEDEQDGFYDEYEDDDTTSYSSSSTVATEYNNINILEEDLAADNAGSRIDVDTLETDDYLDDEYTDDGFEDDYVTEDTFTVETEESYVEEESYGFEDNIEYTEVELSDEDDGFIDEEYMDDDFEEQEGYEEYVEDDMDLEPENSEEIEVVEHIPENRSNTGQKIASSFEKVEPKSETITKVEKISDAKTESSITTEIDEFLDNDEDEQDNAEALDFSMLDDVPLVLKPKQSETDRLEAENEQLRQQLAQLENEKLRQQIKAKQEEAAASAKPASEPVRLKLGQAITNNQTNKANEQQVTPQVSEKELAKRRRWAKYANLSTQELWKLVYRFMTMAGVEKAPVKAKILIEEFGSHNIKRLEATYLMATKDGYTC